MKSFLECMNESYYYHGTSDENANSILKNGIDPTKSLHHKTIYLTTNHNMAQKYSKSGRGKLGTVVKIHKDHLDPKHIKSDFGSVVQYTAPIHSKHISRV